MAQRKRIIFSFVKPNVRWSINGRPLRTSRRIRVNRGNNTLVIKQSRPRDAATYTCEADNGYRRAADSIRVEVEDVEVTGDCTDNPFFANCKLIVKAEYCTNQYYAKFCCRSCTLAGQLRNR